MLFLYCDDGNNDIQDEEIKSDFIASVGWVITNYDTSYFLYDTTYSCYYVFDMTIDEEVSLDEIESATVHFDHYGNDYYWTIDLSNEDNIHEESNAIGGWDNKYYSDLEAGGDVIPIGVFTYKVELKNGNIDTYELVVPPPGKTPPQDSSLYGTKYLFTEDYWASKMHDDYTDSSLYVPMLKRGVIETATMDVDEKEIEVCFSVEDNRVYSGNLWFYASDKSKYVGHTVLFRNYETGLIFTGLNSGNDFYVNGNQNQYIINEENIYFKKDYAFDDIEYVVLVLTDGYQYEGIDSTFDTRSVTSYTEVIINDNE